MAFLFRDVESTHGRLFEIRQSWYCPVGIATKSGIVS
jgi:hypothetical protein